MKYCLNCGKLLAYQKKFCSLRCVTIFTNIHRIRKKKALNNCLVCGKEVSRKGRKYCSKKCMYNSSSDWYQKSSNRMKSQSMRELNSENIKNCWTISNYREKQIEARKGKSPSIKGKTFIEYFGEERAIELINKRLGWKHSEKTKDILSKKATINSINNWKNPEYARKVFEALEIKPNKKEIFLDKILQKEFPGEYKFVGDGYTWIAGKCPDYLNINGRKAVIEHFGCYWHNCPICYPGKGETDEQKRIDHYKKYGFNCLIIWEHELQDINSILKRVEIFTGIKKPEKKEKE